MKEKKKKLNLDELKVQSFVTSLNALNKKTKNLKGGTDDDHTEVDCGSEDLCSGLCASSDNFHQCKLACA